MTEEWGPWIDHDGKGCPLPAGTICEIECRDGECGEIRTEPPKPENEGGDCFCWGTVAKTYRHLEIIRYRIRRPRALIELIDMVENLPAPVGPKVDA